MIYYLSDLRSSEYYNIYIYTFIYHIAHHWPLWRWCQHDVHGFPGRRRIRWPERDRLRQSNVCVESLEARWPTAPERPSQTEREREREEGLRARTRWPAEGEVQAERKRVPYLHNDKREGQHQQDGEFIQHECREHVETYGVAHTHARGFRHVSQVNKCNRLTKLCSVLKLTASNR